MHPINRQITLLLLGIVMFNLPLISSLSQFNIYLIDNLPDFLSFISDWVYEKEQLVNNQISDILIMHTWQDLIMNLFLIGVVPAVCEELFFRGVLQNIFIKWTSKPRLSIIITACLFSILHMQFLGFIPRFILGVLLGYLFYWSRIIWVPIFAHFVHNGLQVIAVFLYGMNQDSSKQILEEETLYTNDQWIMIGGCLFAVCLFLYLFYKITRNKTLIS